jgi:hypothetical protein
MGPLKSQSFAAFLGSKSTDKSVCATGEAVEFLRASLSDAPQNDTADQLTHSSGQVEEQHFGIVHTG